MLDLSNSLIVCSSLLLLMFLVAGSWGGMAVTGRMGVENPYVKKGVLPPLSPHLNFRGTKLLRIDNFRVFRVFIFADARPTILY